MIGKELKTKGIILRRTDYGETDRILSILTPEGKVSAIARGVRKTKSRLAGGVEMLTLADLNIHFNKGEMGVVTSARMAEHYSGILKDINALGVVGELIKKSSAVAESMNDPGVFDVLHQSLVWINKGANVELIKAWFVLNMRKLTGEEINLHRDKNSEKLNIEKKYTWNVVEMAFCEDVAGKYGVTEIKMLRLMAVSPLEVILRVKVDAELLGRVVGFVKMFSE